MISVRTFLAPTFTFAACALLAGCGCDTILVPGIVVQVRDAATGMPIEGPTVRMAATQGAYVDSARFAPASLADERPGTYVVRVEAAGYRPWQQVGVRVREDGCHVKTVNLTASLQPAT